MAMTAEHRGVWILRAAWLTGLIVAVAGLVWLVKVGSLYLRQQQTHVELVQMQIFLERFRARHGVWPKVTTSEDFLLCLLGRRDADGRKSEENWFMHEARLHFLHGKPEAPGATIIDQWGRPYVYCYYHPWGKMGDGYVLFSAGPDGKHSNPNQWERGKNGTAPEDADNLLVSSY